MPSRRPDRRHRRPTGRPGHQRDQARSGDQGHGRDHPRPRRHSRPHRQHHLRRAVVLPHGALFPRSVLATHIQLRSSIIETPALFSEARRTVLEAAAQGLEMEWHYESAQDLEQPLIERLRNFPRQPDMLVYGARVLAATIIRGWLRLYHRLEIIGRENLPADRSFILVANHASHLDTLCLLAALPLGKLHRAFPAAAKDYFFVTVPRLLAAA